MEKRKIILDVDTGTDDAIAIMLAAMSEELDIIGITTVNGNRGIEFTTENTLRVVEFLKKDIKVYKGCSLPMVATLIKGRKDNVPFKGQEDKSENVHEDYIDLPPATIKEEELNAVSFIVDTLMNSEEKITLVPVGPLTNIAMALRIEPRIVGKIEEIMLMGGGYRETNIVPGVEFNFYIDPDAAKIVMDSGCNITMVPLDATHSAALSTTVINKLFDSDKEIANVVASIMTSRLEGYNRWQPMPDQSTVPIHDALAVAALLDRKVLSEVVDCYVDVDVSGGILDGASVCDVERKLKNKEPNVSLALKGDPDLLGEIFIEKFTN